MPSTTSPPAGQPPIAEAAPDVAFRELLAAREIAHAFHTAEHPEDVFRLALDRVCPLVGAAFASVYLCEDQGEFMRLAVAHNWPERYEPWLGGMRVRLGSGPSGQAAQAHQTIEIPDLFAPDAAADGELAEWQEVSRELGIHALAALPLATRNGVLGTLTFYYAGATGFTDGQRAMHRLVADQLAAVAEKARLIADLRAANSALLGANAQLAEQFAAAIEARRVKDEFLTNISHELRTPLTAVIGYVALLREGLFGPVNDDQQVRLGQVRNASERLLGLIDDVLELTTLKHGGLAPVLSSFDPREPMREAVESVAGRPQGVSLVTKEPDDPVEPMLGDRKKVVKILASLLDNAYKFTVQGEVRLSLTVVNARARYSVRDTGPGIVPEAQQVVFDEFRQLDGSPTRRHGGPGLGLALARRLARFMGGDITLESEPGEGSCFILDIPLQYRAENAVPEDDTSHTGSE